MGFPFWSEPCRGCELGWPVRKWQRYDGYGRCFYHYQWRPDFFDEPQIICSNMNWFQRHPYITAAPFLYALALVGAVVLDSVHK